jgi:NADH dehydrogenase
MLATIGRAQAVAQMGFLRLSGLPAWLLWCVVHVFLLIEFRSRVRVMLEWVWYYLTFKPGARIIYQAVDKARQPRSRIAQRLNVPKRTPRLFARCGLAGQPF